MPGSHSTRKIPDLKIGDEFDRLTIEAATTRRWKHGSIHRYYVCRCRCGGTREVSIYNLVRGEVRSCGCLKREDSSARLTALVTTHGGSDTRLYGRWCGIRKRCQPDGELNYGQRGIRVCPEWESSWETFRDWAMANGYRDDLTIERVDVNGHYSPENCTWIPLSDQSRNRRNIVWITAWGETRRAQEWAKDPRCRVCRTTLRIRVRNGWDHEQALTTNRLRPKHRS
jgi:hypothetical protein